MERGTCGGVGKGSFRLGTERLTGGPHRPDRAEQVCSGSHCRRDARQGRAAEPDDALDAVPVSVCVQIAVGHLPPEDDFAAHVVDRLAGQVGVGEDPLLRILDRDRTAHHCRHGRWPERKGRRPRPPRRSPARRQPLAGLGDSNRGRVPPGTVPAAQGGLLLRELGHDLLIVIIGVQRQSHREVEHDMRRTLPVRPLRLPPMSSLRVIVRITRHRRRQHPQRDQLRQPKPTRRTLNTLIHQGNLPIKTSNSSDERTTQHHRDQLALSGIGS